LWPLVVAFLGLAIELAERKHADIEFLGERCACVGDFADFGGWIAAIPIGSLDLVQVVENEKVETFVLLPAAEHASRFA
jgi:hypothetical protein